MAINRKALYALMSLALAAGPAAYAQSRNNGGQSKKQSFEEFRSGILHDYQDFRQTLLDRYADFLNGEWHAYESFNGVKRDNKPKPRTVPRVEIPKKKPVAEPVPELKPKPRPEVKPEPLPELKPEPKPAPKPEVKPAPKPAPKPEDKPAPKPEGRRDSRAADAFDFFTIPLQVPRVDFSITDRLYANSDYAAQWRELQEAEVADRLLPHITSLATELGLNDYLTFQLINSYIDSKFAGTDATSRMSAVHYLLANLGYDARIAVTGEGVPLLLIPFKQTIYSRTYMMIGDRKYYVFEPEGFSLAKAGPQSIMTCRLPDDVDKGRRMDLVVGRLNLPEKPRSFDFECGPIHLTGEVNENLMPVLYHYPQMPVSDFANSDVQPELRRKLIAQMRSQLEGLDGDDKVARLLEFMHSVFEYATDEDNHGFEKPYFLEETLYYPKNDCEDRAIFYTYFLWNALGKEAQLISFPGHEAATVRLDNPVEGTCYDYEGATYYISDPTFIGSKTGMIMPPYKSTAPNIDYTYK